MVTKKQLLKQILERVQELENYIKSDVIKWNGVDVIRFQEKGRNPQDGRLIYTDGFALPDPMEKDHIIEVKYIRCAYPNEIEKHGLKELGELFLKSVFIGNGR